MAVTPALNRYFYAPEGDLDLTLSAAIPAGEFVNDAGEPVTDFAGLGPNAFNNLFINGILQPGNFYEAGPDGLFFPPQNSTIYAGTPIVLETVQLTINVIV